MLWQLRIKNFAIIDQLEVEFAPGFNILTGETGAGKSILIDALTLLLGAKPSPELVRSGEEFTEVEAVFDLEIRTGLKKFLEELGLEPENQLIIRRKYALSGRSSCWINLHPVPVSALSRLREWLVDIYGQHEYQSLLRPEHHLSLLDSYARIWERFSDYQELYSRFQKKKAEYKKKLISEQERKEKLEILKFRISELEKARLREGEEEALEEERSRLKHLETLRQAGETGYERLYNQEGAVVEQLAEIISQLERAGEYDFRLSQQAKELAQAQAIIEEVGRELGEYLAELDASPGRLEEIEERRAELRRLKRKYQMEIPELLQFLEKSKSELEELENYQSFIEELESQLKEVSEQTFQRAKQLSQERKKQAKKLCEKLVQNLKELGMGKCQFEVRFDNLEQPQSWGIDRVEFYLSPNPGEELKPLSKIASGGELSRIMLGLRSILARQVGARILIFDEVDTGIGGAIAEVVGKKLKELSKSNQVLCVTHLPQIAKFADHHLRVWKEEEKGRTVVRIKPLSPEERIEELARMLGGLKITEKTRAYAREMLEQARR